VTSASLLAARHEGRRLPDNMLDIMEGLMPAAFAISICFIIGAIIHTMITKGQGQFTQRE